ncbi:Lrp/AsnC family transcriptional regulator [Streptomyces sp. CoT10]|uniref:Lrp/AsnC family transcriptional regulator n=1 Tax=Streptomyces sp. CoT10 TaxID=2875762 RepID=UPI0027DFA915|nr:Lrp/AsnC family transcriptional regulator [Streptomyces sp. CoT10]
MDDIDRAILRELQTDGRIAYADLGPKVGLSASAARQRLQRLLDSKTVQVVGVTDPMAMGGQAMALLGIGVDGDPRAVADELAGRPEVVYSVLTVPVGRGLSGPPPVGGQPSSGGWGTSTSIVTSSLRVPQCARRSAMTWSASSAGSTAASRGSRSSRG